MGAGSAKLLPGLIVGPEDKEDRLKKGKIDRVLTSGPLPKQQNLVWKQLPLNKDNLQFTTQNILEGAQFIHEGRMQNKETLVIIQEKDPDSVVFATAYLMAISGLSPQSSQLAITRSLKEQKLTGQYEAALRALRTAYNPKALREAVTTKAGNYAPDKLKDDVCKVYELVGLTKPTPEEISLEVPADETKRMSLMTGGAPSKDDKRKSSTDPDAALMGKAAGILGQDLEAKQKVDTKDEVSAGLKKLVKDSKDQGDSYSEPLSKELMNSLMALQAGKKDAELQKVLSKINKRGEIIVPLSFYMKPDIEFDNFSLTAITATGGWTEGKWTQGGTAAGSLPSSTVQPSDTNNRDSWKDTSNTDSRPSSTVKPSNTDNRDSWKDTSITDSHPSAPAQPDKDQSKNKGELNKSGSVDYNSKDSPKADILFDRFINRYDDKMDFDDIAYTESGFIVSDKGASGWKDQSSVQGGSAQTPTSPKPSFETNSTTNTESGSRRYKITIVRAYSKEPADSTAHVDAYLNSLTDEERRKNRKHVTIIRAFSRDAYSVEN